MKTFYKDKREVRKYIESCDGKDGRFLIEILKKHLRPNCSVLELGFGSGQDLEIIRKTFEATGSDYSQVFIDLFLLSNPNADLLLLDAKTLRTNRKFDCIYSNKVLHHLSTKDLDFSLNIQKKLLKKNGILFHSFWHGDRREELQDLKFIQYKIDELKDIVEKDFRIIEIERYNDMNLNDSIYLILQAH